MVIHSQDGLQIKNVVDHDLNELFAWSKKWLMTFNPDKTEIMIFSNTEIEENLNFSFNGNPISISNSHKHLGVTFSSDAKWNDHVNNIVTSISKHLGILRKLKYTLSRRNLEQLYLVYIRPLFEYASEVWDNCGICNSNKLEQMQLEAARIVTGLPIFTKIDFLYKETGWELLSVRRNRRKLQMFHSIVNHSAPSYLCNLLPPTIQSTTVYPLRNGGDIIVPFCRMSLTRESYIPSTIRKWNNLDQSLRNISSLPKFKKELQKLDRFNVHCIPKYYFYGPRKLNVILTQLRCSASFLNYDLYRAHILTDPSCQCGADVEDAKHFLLECPRYVNIRTTLLHNLNWLSDEVNISVELLTCGNSDLSDINNEKIFKCVFEYIKGSNRFLQSCSINCLC